MDDDLAPTIAIECTSNQYLVDIDQLSQLALRISQLLQVADYELNIQFVDNEEIHGLNRTFRKIDRPTDVLAFPQLEWQQPRTVQGGSGKISNASPAKMLGDIVISLEEAARNAENINHPLVNEVVFLMAHGVLHLCGHDHHDKSEEEVMIAQQKIILQDDFIQQTMKQTQIRKLNP